MKWKAINVRCDKCGAIPGAVCTGPDMTSANPHWARVLRAKLRETLQDADTLALDNSRDRRTLEELLMEALR